MGHLLWLWFKVQSSSPVKSLCPRNPLSSSSRLFSNFNSFTAYKQHLNQPASGSSALEVPLGAEGCLTGLTLVVTGDLRALSRDQVIEYIKRLGGRLTSAISGKTDYVVVGENPGPSKMEAIKQLRKKTFTEAEFYDFIGTLPAQHVPTNIEAATTQSEFSYNQQAPSYEKCHLLVEKYKPNSVAEILGNGGNISRLIKWLREWKQEATGSKDEMRAVLISGPPGVGKTTAAILACRELGLAQVEMNASDTRSKASLQDHIQSMLDNSGLGRFLGMPQKAAHIEADKVLIMDEVDGMSAGDRGGIAQLIQFIKKTKIPIICICNDRTSTKVRSLANHCLDLRFARPDARTIARRIGEIAAHEGIAMQPNGAEQLVTGCGSDLRQILNTLQWVGESKTKQSLSYDDILKVGKEGKKDSQEGIFDVVPELLGHAYDRMKMPDRLDRYFVDSSLIPLMIHENFLRAAPSGSQLNDLKILDSMAKATDSFSQSDYLVDALIHGSNQQFSLSPLHAFMTCVLPAYYFHGGLRGRVEFASWLGQNSKQSKNIRVLRELKLQSVLTASVGKSELRLYHVPCISGRVIELLRHGDISAAIAVLDAYGWTKENMNDAMELCVGKEHSSSAYSLIPTATKSAFTRQYNKMIHPLPLLVATSAKRVASEFSLNSQNEDDDQPADDLSSEEDSLILEKKPKAAPPAKRKK